MTQLVENVENDDQEEETIKACFKEEFREVQQVQEFIQSIPNIYGDQISVEMATEKFTWMVLLLASKKGDLDEDMQVIKKCIGNMSENAVQWKEQFLDQLALIKDIIDQYQEQPHLLDAHLASLLQQLLAHVKNTESPDEVVHLAFKFLYLLTKTRGYKVIVRMMPHEVADLEPVLNLLSKQNPNDYQTWETRYMLLLWLSIVSMIPFDMVRLDSNRTAADGQTKKPVMERITQAGKTYILVSDKSRDAAAYMLSRFMTRPDVKKDKLPEFLDWAVQTLHKSDGQTMQGMNAISGVLAVLSLLFKHGKREDLITYAGTILKEVLELKLYQSSNTILRKLGIKLIQRIGLIFLKVRVASWRYQRGSRSLQENLQVDTERKEILSDAKTNSNRDDEDYDIPEELEDIIERLLQGLRDPHTIVRWSAAKGVGRVTGRLPRELADEVVGSLLELFTIAESDCAWHGGCLALAELGRRGLLLPQRLPDVAPVIIRALSYDEKRGNFSVGAHVRDAACYVCWAFARAYEPADIRPYVQKIASALVITSIFDREVNVRRAAAAAFQENVGRQGQFPHGIDIVTACDYYAVGNRTNCFLQLSVFIAEFQEYTQALLDHLANVTISHWDIAVRELTAQALHNLTANKPDYMATIVLPKLLEDRRNLDLNLRHGSIIAAAEVALALANMAQSKNKCITEMVGQDSSEKLKTVAHELYDAKLFRGIGGELMRKAVCYLIQKLSLARMPYQNDPIIERWQQLIDDCLAYQDEEVQQGAVNAIPAFFTQYYINCDICVIKDIQEKILSKYLAETKNNVETTRCGYTLALGALPKAFIAGHLERVLETLYTASRITEKEVKWAAARRDAVKSMETICRKVEVAGQGSSDTLGVSHIKTFYETLFTALADYTQDSRGDVGAWVREASMACLETITTQIVQSDPSLLDPDVVCKVFCHLVQQAMEKIDRTRACAGQVFFNLLHYKKAIPHIPHREELLKIFPREECESINWAVPASTFPKFTQLLSLEQYSYSALLGLTVSVGGLTESLVKHSSASLRAYLRQIEDNKEDLTIFAAKISLIFRDYLKQDRVTLPMFKMLDQLLANGHFSLYIDNPNNFPAELLELGKLEISKCGNPQKLITSIDMFCGLLQFPDVRKKCLTQLMLFLAHKYPIVRKSAASKLYEALLTYESDLDEENMDSVTNLLSDTQWDQPIAEIKPVRNQLCELLGVPVPVIKTKAATTEVKC